MSGKRKLLNVLAEMERQWRATRDMAEAQHEGLILFRAVEARSTEEEAGAHADRLLAACPELVGAS